MNLSQSIPSGTAPLQFGFTVRDVAFCSMPVIALCVSILTLL